MSPPAVLPRAGPGFVCEWRVPMICRGHWARGASRTRAATLLGLGGLLLRYDAVDRAADERHLRVAALVHLNDDLGVPDVHDSSEHAADRLDPVPPLHASEHVLALLLLVAPPADQEEPHDQEQQSHRPEHALEEEREPPRLGRYGPRCGGGRRAAGALRQDPTHRR